MKIRTVFLLIFFLLTKISFSQEITVDYVIEQMKNKAKTLETFTANFEQKKISALFDNEELSSGKFFYQKKDKFLLVYEKPNKNSILSIGKELTIISEKTEKADFYKVKKGPEHQEGFWGFGGTFEDAKKKFEIEISSKNDEITIKLVPLEENPTAKYFTEIYLTVNKCEWLPKKIKMIDNDEDVTEIDFKNYKENVTLDKKTFSLKIPSNYKKVEH